MMKKMTKKEMLEQIKAHLTDAAEIEFVEHEIELLSRKRTSVRPTATQVENEKIKMEIVAFLEEEPENAYTISDIIAGIEIEEPISNQKISALLRQLVQDNQVQKLYEKRKAFFKAA